MQKVMFSKMLQPCESLDKVAEILTDIGFDGVDLTVRDKGHILPEEAKAKLPDAVKVFEKHGLTVPMITTDISDMSRPHAEEVIATAVDCGVTHMKLGYWRYEGFGTLRTSLLDAQKALAGIEPVVRKYGITAGVHIHSGNDLSADGAIVHEIIRDCDPRCIGAYVDSGHMAIEGGKSGWKMCLDILANRIVMVALKDLAIWKEDGKWKSGVVPMGEGFVQWQDFLNCLKQTPFDGVMTWHSEYHFDSVDEIVEQTKKDFAFVNGIWAK
ncbi:MAG: sugar phosphate isomerase/epimerase [Planctomycetes bacterium]|nr:sugar phosphate isomerase/epimerase [Planctomycetota bacterium]